MKYCVLIISFLLIVSSGCKKKAECQIVMVSPVNNATYRSGDSISAIFNFKNCLVDTYCFAAMKYSTANSEVDSQLYFRAFPTPISGNYSIAFNIFNSASSADTVALELTGCPSQTIFAGGNIYILP